MSVRKHIKILEELELTEVESKLLDVNKRMLASEFLCIKKVAISGIQNLIKQVDFRYTLLNLMNRDVFGHNGIITVKRW